MGFLLKVKRAKFVLDKARRLMWKVNLCHFFLQCFGSSVCYEFSFWTEHITIYEDTRICILRIDVDNVISCRPHVLRLSIYMIFELPWSLLCLLQGRGTVTNNRKHHWLVEQKLLHFVDAFHQYVMDRVRLAPLYIWTLLSWEFYHYLQSLTCGHGQEHSFFPSEFVFRRMNFSDLWQGLVSRYIIVHGLNYVKVWQLLDPWMKS